MSTNFVKVEAEWALFHYSIDFWGILSPNCKFSFWIWKSVYGYIHNKVCYDLELANAQDLNSNQFSFLDTDCGQIDYN